MINPSLSGFWTHVNKQTQRSFACFFFFIGRFFWIFRPLEPRKFCAEFPTHPASGYFCRSILDKDYLKNNKGTLNYIEFIHKFKPEWADLRETHRTFYEYDFYIEFYNGLKIIVEIDGAQHYQQVSNWTTPLHNQIRDHIKERLAVNEKRSTNVIRLKQEDIMNDTNNWQKKFEKFVTQKKSNNDEIEIIQAY